ncbi:MAG TPA: response regulator [Acidisphaera sp.]|nr:response regulator [Acidisphaera sp.]
MVVDDTGVSRALLINGLNELGFEHIQIAKDGKQALEALRAKPVHLVFSDFNMPHLDGLQLLKALRGAPATSAIGFILVTGAEDKALIMRGQQLGMNNYLAKPFDRASLKSTIEAVVGPL